MYKTTLQLKGEFSGLGSQIKEIIKMYDEYYGDGNWKLTFCKITGPSDNGFGLIKLEKFLHKADCKTYIKLLPDDIQFIWGLFSFFQGEDARPIGFFEPFDTSYFIFYSNDKFFLEHCIGVFGGGEKRSGIYGKIEKSEYSYDDLCRDSNAKFIEKLCRG